MGEETESMKVPAMSKCCGCTEALRRIKIAVDLLYPHTRHTLPPVDSPGYPLIKAISNAFDVLEWGHKDP